MQIGGQLVVIRVSQEQQLRDFFWNLQMALCDVVKEAMVSALP